MKALSHTFAALMLMVHRTDAALMHRGGGGIVVMLIFLNVLALLSIGAERCSDICVDIIDYQLTPGLQLQRFVFQILQSHTVDPQCS